MITVGKTATTIPDLAPFLPPQVARHPLSDQATVDQALAPLDIPSQDVEDSYTYDAGGNRIGETSPPCNYSVDQLDQITSRHYDLDGNPITLGNRTLGYDQRERLVDVKDGSNKQSIFSATYDAQGRRITLQEVSGETHFIYDGPSEIAEYRNSTLFSEHVVAAPPDDRVHLVLAKKEYLVHRDLIGSTRLLTDKNGSSAARYEFDPYGRVVLGGFEGPSYRYRFMGREWDAGIDLYHFRARHYEVETGRFLQRDPAEFEPRRSAYQAFGSNPLLYVDPFGTMHKESHTGDPKSAGVASWLNDSLTLLIDDVGMFGWGTLSLFSFNFKRMRTVEHFGHWRFGHGEPVTVPKEWIFDSPSWAKDYSLFLESSMSDIRQDVATRIKKGEVQGKEHFSPRTLKDSLSLSDWPVPWSAGADQFFASGHADFSVEADYMWFIPKGSSYVRIDIHNIVG